MSKLSREVVPAGFVQEHRPTLHINEGAWDSLLKFRQTTWFEKRPAHPLPVVKPLRLVRGLGDNPALLCFEFPMCGLCVGNSHTKCCAVEYYMLVTVKSPKSKLCEPAGARCSGHGWIMVGSAVQYSCGYMHVLLRIYVQVFCVLSR